jgi:hypothetical protein
MFDPSLMVQQGPNPGERFAQAFQQGQQTRQQNMAKAAMAALSQRPEQRRWRLAQVDPQGAMQFQQQQRQNHLKDLDAHRDSIKIGAEIIRSFNVKDEPSYQRPSQAIRGAERCGHLAAPGHLRPKAMSPTSFIWPTRSKPEKAQQDRIITPQPGGGAWALGPDGALHQLIAPNDGSQPPGAPVAGPAPGTVVADPRLQGGATGAAPSSMFP